jgi:hypothetical protein
MNERMDGWMNGEVDGERADLSNDITVLSGTMHAGQGLP